VAGPALLVLIAKALRRRGREREADAARRVVGGWDEFVDVAVDHGRPPPRTHTRAELAEVYGGAAPTLAAGADRAVFSDEPIDESDSAEFWRIVDEERRRFARELPMWRRALA